jgi:putative ABC transport system substrate-binding protein
MPVIEFLGSPSRDLWAPRLLAFHQGLSKTGYLEGRDVTVEYRWAEGQNTRLSALAADLVSRQVTVITALGSTPAALAAKAATTTIPIVFEIASDPIEELARKLGLQFNVVQASSVSDFDAVFASLVQQQTEALVIGVDPLFTSHVPQLAELALRHALPTVYEFREFAAAGGLLSYGASLTGTFDLAGIYNRLGQRPRL